MLSLQFPSGNTPSSVTSIDRDKLVHWCHGAPGWIYMFIQAYRVSYRCSYGVSSFFFNILAKITQTCINIDILVTYFYSSSQKYSDRKYLEAAKRCADVIWSRGILKKGYGLCHGTSGNGYCFLAMHKLMGEKLYLHRAIKVLGGLTHTPKKYNYGNLHRALSISIKGIMGRTQTYKVLWGLTQTYEVL
jgi:hypothetical protein